MTKNQNIFAFFIDSPEKFKPKFDTSLALMQAAQRKEYQVAYFTLPELSYDNGKVNAHLHFVSIDLERTLPLVELHQRDVCLFDCAAVAIRKDPPFDENYLYATYLLDLVAAQGVYVTNNSTSVRDCNEKIFAAHFAAWTPNTCISQSGKHITEFLATHKKIVLKPLNAMAGQDVIIVEASNVGNKSLINLMTQNDQRMILAQAFIPEVHQGDKRIFLFNGEALPYALLRVPAQDDFRANLAVGGTGTVVELNDHELELCTILKPELQKRQLDFVGIDVIHGLLTEINVTSPTGIRPIIAETGFDVADLWLQNIMKKLRP